MSHKNSRLTGVPHHLANTLAQIALPDDIRSFLPGPALLFAANAAETAGTSDASDEEPLATGSETSVRLALSDSAETPTIPLASPTAPRSQKPRIIVALMMLCGVAFIAGLVVWYYHARALPGVWIGTQTVQAKNLAQMESIARKQADLITITFYGEGKQTRAALADIGVSIDTHKTAQNALNAKRSTTAGRLTFWRKTYVPLAYSFDKPAFTRYMAHTFPGQWTPASDAAISYNTDTKQYDVLAGTDGTGIDQAELLRRLNQAVYNPAALDVGLTAAPIKPAIDNIAADKARQTANGYLASDIIMTHGGRTVFTLEPQEIATLLDISPDSRRGLIEVRPNPDKVAAFVAKDIANTVAQEGRSQIVIINPGSGQSYMVQAGLPGHTLDSQAALVANISKSLFSRTPFHTEVTLSEKPFETQSYTGTTRWIDVNLSTQTTRLMLDDTAIAAFRISSGKAATPTDVGEHYIRSKFPKQTMSGTINGESYYVPNIPWVSYFDADAEAFHGTYWHNNFGIPMSHGCINMTIADAKTLYDYAPIGTRVRVHY